MKINNGFFNKLDLDLLNNKIYFDKVSESVLNVLDVNLLNNVGWVIDEEIFNMEK